MSSLFEDLLLIDIADNLNRANAQARQAGAREQAVVRLIEWSEALEALQTALDNDAPFTPAEQTQLKVHIRCCREQLEIERNIIDPPLRESIWDEWSGKIARFFT